MAHPTFSLPLGGVSHSPSVSRVERLILRYVEGRSARALDELSRYDELLQRFSRTLRRRAVPRHPTLSWLISAQFTRWHTVDELSQHSDRTLDDIQVPREAIKAIATLSAFGWPREEAQAATAREGMLAGMRRRFMPTDGELEEAYLAAAADLNDLEYRMQEWERRSARRPWGRAPA
jgi:hypothetical protein